MTSPAAPVQVLVIDDSSTIHKMIDLALQSVVVQVAHTQRPDEALLLLPSIPRPDVALVDLGLSIEGGVDTFAEIRALGIPMVLLMGSYDAVDDDAFRRAGYRHFLKKPFDAGALIRRIEEVCGRSLQRRDNSGARPHYALESGGLATGPENREDVDEVRSRIGQVELPPLPQVDPTRRGRPAFQDAPVGSRDQATHQQPTFAAPLRNETELAADVRAMVERYCREHFPSVARQILTEEIRRLTE